jgi:hypothetical protein
MPNRTEITNPTIDDKLGAAAIRRIAHRAQQLANEMTGLASFEGGTPSPSLLYVAQELTTLVVILQQIVSVYNEKNAEPTPGASEIISRQDLQFAPPPEVYRWMAEGRKS